MENTFDRLSCQKKIIYFSYYFVFSLRSFTILLVYLVSRKSYNIAIRSGSRTAATSKMERFVIIVNSFLSLTIITKRSIMDVAEVLDPMSLAKFNNFCQRFLKRANSQIINFLEKSCNNLSVKISFLLTHFLPM